MAEAIVAALRVRHETDPAKEIFDDLGDLSGYRVGGPDLLIAVYERRGKTSGGIFLPDRTADNDKWGGCTGLIVKMGPRAYRTEKTEGWFVDDAGRPKPPKVGDWIVFDPKQGHMFLIDKRMCRVIPDQYAFLVIPEPDAAQ